MKYSRALQRFGLPLAMVFFVSGCSAPEPPASTAPGAASGPAISAGPTGTIHGIVHLTGKPPAPSVDKISQDQATCGNSVALPRIVLGKTNGVKDTFVYLEGVSSVLDPEPASSASVLLDQKKCQYEPHAMTVPVGTKLEITNSDSILHNVHGNIIGSQGMQTLFNIAQPIQGQHGNTPALDKPGIVYLTCEAGHPWMNAYILVADNPFATLTKDDGEFTISKVPVGKYAIKMWHEGVTLKQNNKTLQRYDYEDPYEMTKDVVVTANGNAVVNFDLTLRSGK